MNIRKDSLQQSETETAVSYQPNRWTRHAIRPFLIASMTTALVMGLLILIDINSANTNWFTLLPLLFLVALEATTTTQWLRHPDRLKVDRTAYRAAELIFITLVTRIISWLLFEGGIPNLAEIQTYLSQPASFFLEAHFILSIIFVLLVWRLTVSVSSLFSIVTLTEYEIHFYTLPAAERKERQGDQPIQHHRGQAVAQFQQQWLWGGIFLVGIVALGSFDLGAFTAVASPFAISRLGIPPQMLISLLLYFGCGLWLLSQARLAVLNARWLQNGYQKNGNVDRVWHASSLILLLGIALVAAFIPIGSTVPIARLIGLLISGLIYVAQFIFFLGALLLTAVLSLFATRTTPTDPQPTPPPLPTLPPAAAPIETGAESLLPRLIFSSAFWAITIVITILGVLYFLRERDIRLTPENLRRYWRTFTAWAKQTWQAFWAKTEQLRTNLQSLRTNPHPDKDAKKRPPRWRFIRVNGLSPRDQIRYFYLSTVRRAGQRGIQRQQNVTPSEYVEELKQAWPDAEQEVDDLTEAFLQARYSPKPIEKEAINPVKKTWKQVKSALRRQSRQDQEEES